MTEYIDVLTAGGTIVVDFTDTLYEGLVAHDGDGTKGEAIQAVRDNIEAGNVVMNANGEQTLILPDAPLAYSYRHGEKPH